MYCEIIITISSYSLPHIVNNFFLVMRIFKTYTLSNFHIHNTVLLTIVTITSPIIILTGSLHFLTTFTNFTHPRLPATTSL